MLAAPHAHLVADQAEEISFRWLLAVLGALPALSYLALLVFATAAFVSVGHWPAASYPDPKSFSSTMVALLWLAMAAAAGAAPVYFVIAALHAWHLRGALSRVDVGGMAVYVVGLALWLFGSRNLLLWFFA